MFQGYLFQEMPPIKHTVRQLPQQEQVAWLPWMLNGI
jgi:hypothetical protein